MADLALKHQTFRADATFYYYEGELPIRAGILVLPDGRDDLLTRAWRDGYQINPATDQPYNPEDARKLLSV